MSTDLILKSFNGVAQQKSYGGKSLQENLLNAQKAIERVAYTEKISFEQKQTFNMGQKLTHEETSHHFFFGFDFYQSCLS